MPSTPPFPFKSAPDGVITPPAAPVIVTQPILTISYPDTGFGLCNDAIIQIDTMPIFDREPTTVPDVPGAGWSYNQFLEYLDMGITPDGAWSGAGAVTWTVLCDGLPTDTTFFARDGTPGPLGVFVQYMEGPPLTQIDFSVPHSWSLMTTYEDRPGYTEYYIDPTSVGVSQFGPTTDTADPLVPYVLGGVAFGCDERSLPFFPSVLWGNVGYHNEWVAAHHNVSDTAGPVDRNGDTITTLTGPWGSDVQSQYLSSGPGEVPCSGATNPGHLPDQPGGAGDVYASSLGAISENVSYAAVTYDYTTTAYTLPACQGTGIACFDMTRVHRVR